MTVPRNVGVLGGGTMGAGIAHSFLTAGANVVVVERDPISVDAARKRIFQGLEKAAKFEPLNLDEILSRTAFSTDFEAFRSAELVIEAVPEDPSLKSEALSKVERELSDSAWLTTNTSSLSISELSRALRRPDRFCGLHFFNPVPRSRLVEIVSTEKTRAELVQEAKAWVSALGKTPIVVQDAPGFASSRLGVALALEAMRMLEENVASAKDIDAAMVLGYKHAAGPLLTTDLVGLDVRLQIAEYLASTLGPRFAPPQILRDKVSRGELGKKTGKGFFTYE